MNFHAVLVTHCKNGRFGMFFLVEITLPSEISASSKIAAKNWIPNLKDSRDCGGISFSNMN